jgi:hypothetical protein
MPGSISDTPPPCAVELIIQSVRPRSARATGSASSRSACTVGARCAYCSYSSSERQTADVDAASHVFSPFACHSPRSC